MTLAEIPSLNPSYEEEIAPVQAKGRHGYYKRSPRVSNPGWITVGSSSPSNRHDYEFKGYRFLSEYGDFVLGTSDPRSVPQSRDVNGRPWNPAIESFRLLFQLGGAKEFPIEQIVAMKWHIRLPYKEVVFPQLEGKEVFNFTCPECDQERIFASLDEGEAALALRYHLTCKIDARHEYRPEDLARLGQLEGINFYPNRIGRVSVRGDSPATKEPIDTGLGSFACPDCGKLTKSEFGLRAHMRSHVKIEREE